MSTPLGPNPLATLPPPPMIGAGGSGMPFGMPLNPYLQQQAQQRFRQMAAQSVQRWVIGPNGQPILESFPVQMIQRPVGYALREGWNQADPTANLKIAHQVLQQRKKDPKAFRNAALLGLGFGGIMHFMFDNGSANQPWIKTASALDRLPILGRLNSALHNQLMQGKIKPLQRLLGYLTPDAYLQDLIRHDVNQLTQHQKIKAVLSLQTLETLRVPKSAEALAEAALKLRNQLNPKNSAHKWAYARLDGLNRRYADGLKLILEHYNDLHRIYERGGNLPLKPLGRAIAATGYFLHRLAFGGAMGGYFSTRRVAKFFQNAAKWTLFEFPVFKSLNFLAKVFAHPVVVKPMALILPMLAASLVGEALFSMPFKNKAEALTKREGWHDFTQELFSRQAGTFLGWDAGPAILESLGVFRKLGMGLIKIPLLATVFPQLGISTYRGFANTVGAMSSVNVAIEKAGDKMADLLFDNPLAMALFGEKPRPKVSPPSSTPSNPFASESFTSAPSQYPTESPLSRDPRFAPSIPAAQSLIGQGIFLDPRHDARLNALSMA